MQKITNIVLTGGPCAGKTTALAKITQYFTYRGFAVYTQPEASNLFIQGGVNFLTDDPNWYNANIAKRHKKQRLNSSTNKQLYN